MTFLKRPRRIKIKSMFGIFCRVLKRWIFGTFYAFFHAHSGVYVSEKRWETGEKAAFQARQKNPKHALNVLDMKYTFFLIFILGFTTCNKKEILFTGFEPINKSSALLFDTVKLDPVFLNQKKFGSNLPDYYSWDVYKLNDQYNIIHYCTSRTGLDFEIRDSIFINNRAYSLSHYYGGNAFQFRVLEILKFEFTSKDYYLLIGADMLESGNRLFNNIIFLIKENGDSSAIFCPPLLLRGNNARPFFPYYINDFDGDKNLDFLQMDLTDSIFLYSIAGDTLLKRKEFIKLFQKNEDDGNFYIDVKSSNWPYPFFKSDSLNPKLKEKLNHYQYRDFSKKYYSG